MAGQNEHYEKASLTEIIGEELVRAAKDDVSNLRTALLVALCVQNIAFKMPEGPKRDREIDSANTCLVSLIKILADNRGRE